MLKDITSEKSYLLQFAVQVDPFCRDMLDDALPDFTTFRMSKHDVCHKLLDAWEIHWFLLSKKNLSIIRGE
jgi:hypothetical protein